MVLAYVDDMLITSDSLKLIKDTKTSLQETFKMKGMGELKCHDPNLGPRGDTMNGEPEGTLIKSLNIITYPWLQKQ